MQVRITKIKDGGNNTRDNNNRTANTVSIELDTFQSVRDKVLIASIANKPIIRSAFGVLHLLHLA